MNSVTVTLANRTYALRAGTSVRRLEKRLIAAVRHGAGFVRLPVAAGREVHALVSPATPITIELSSAPSRASSASPAAATPCCDADVGAEGHVHQAAPLTGDAAAEWMGDPAIDWLDFERGLTQSS